MPILPVPLMEMVAIYWRIVIHTVATTIVRAVCVVLVVAIAAIIWLPIVGNIVWLAKGIVGHIFIM